MSNLLRFAHYSRFFQRIDRRYRDSSADYLPELAPGEPQRAAMQTTFDALRHKGLDISAALRILRQLVMHRLIQLDCEQHAALSLVTRAVTDLAELALEIALKTAYEELDALHGNVSNAQMWIVGMGKLGARELNVSSDIDLIYVYDQDGETTGNETGRNKISHHEYFAKAVKIVYDLVGATTEHGFVFRVDLALRPHGNSGPAAISLSGLEQYLQVQGREWERFAWLKSRVVAPQACIANHSAKALRDVVLPFVFRKYLDYNVFESLRTLHRQIRQESARRSAGRPERANDVKLSRGGIREIEFTVQLLQVVRGGQYPELRKRPTLDALQRVARAGLMPQATADALCAAYEFLRRVEHRIQYLDDQQTHAMPTQDADLQWIAQTMGYKECDSDSCAFLTDLDTHRELVANEFDKLLGGFQQTNPNSGSGSKDCGTQACKVCPTPTSSTSASVSNAAASCSTAAFDKRVTELSEHPRVLNLREDARGRLMRLVERTNTWLQSGRVTELAALRSADFLEPLLRRESYLALLWERPVVHERLLKLLGSARWPAKYLLQHPGVMDELAGDAWLTERFDAPEFEAELALRLKSLQSTGEDDVETLLNLLRRAHHAELFRTLARDIEGQLTVEQVADDLSALADTVLRVTVAWCWERHKSKHLAQPQIAIIGYGKLGGKELGYGSDLDIVFIYEDADENAGEIYSSFVRKLITWLDTKTSEGDLFEIDTALRPNGGSGLLVTSFAAFSDYQEKRGSNTAWTWEHQAMTRARFVAGYAPLRTKFDQVRQNVISAPRDLPALKQEIIAMRDKVRTAHTVKADQFDVKHSPGGMVDAEFAVQYLVLAHSAAHPELQANVGNIALMRLAEAAGLLPTGIGTNAADAYRSLRHAQHVARLDEAPTQVSSAELHTERDAMLTLWNAVFAI
jgi:[glutamine synthetase] adenylyltransferase / [glutamine synthetase]-adenylyl-L-tyrosine phosphorylase